MVPLHFLIDLHRSFDDRDELGRDNRRTNARAGAREAYRHIWTTFGFFVTLWATRTNFPLYFALIALHGKDIIQVIGE
jgi:hypothetical protein